MYTLILSISCSVAVSVLLKLARGRAIQVDQAIAFNYVMAGSLCWLLLGPQPSALLESTAQWPLLLALGLLLPSVFLIMAKAVQQAGIVLSDAAQRLSLLLPLIAAFTLFGESATQSKLAGIAIALCALAALLWRPDNRNAQTSAPYGGLMTVALLLGVWLGYGSIDILFKQMAKAGSAFPTTLLGAFILAGLLSFTYLLVRRTNWSSRSALAGLLLGLLNFGNIYFYVRAHQVYSDNPTLVFSAMNIGVISLGTVIGAGVFRERIHWVNGLGVGLAILAVFVLFPR
ncbi:EamA/RhaT family transporter [Achromobacter sp. F4_2707]|uniref:EamA/RhaT family transporter n=1 Tax=Achromobacter sp. F4_2707 TaxID=3114286 RepID=UPI0039C5E42D